MEKFLHCSCTTILLPRLASVQECIGRQEPCVVSSFSIKTGEQVLVPELGVVV